MKNKAPQEALKEILEIKGCINFLFKQEPEEWTIEMLEAHNRYKKQAQQIADEKFKECGKWYNNGKYKCIVIMSADEDLKPIIEYTWLCPKCRQTMREIQELNKGIQKWK